MKKGLLALTMLVVFASSVFAYAPVISNIPDIIVGDDEDGDANNFFIFSDAFNFDDYVADQDDADATLKWSFAKLGGSTGDITINGKDAEASDYINPTNELRSVSDQATIRDIVASPLAQDPGPYTGSLSDVYIAMYVSDGVAEDSDEVRVTSVDGAEDGMSGIGAEVTETYENNDPGTGGGDYWEQFDGSFQDPGSTYGSYDAVNGALKITFPSTTFTGWYQWVKWNADKTGTADTVTYTAGKLVAVKAKISASKDSQNPSIRLRVGSQDFAYTAMTAIASQSDGTGGGPTTSADDFVFVYKPQGSTDDAFIAFDHWATVNTGEISVEELKIYKIDEPSLTSELSVTDLSSFGAAGADAAKVTIGDDISIAPTTTWATAAGFVNLASAATVDKLYKVTYSVGSTGTGDVNGFRMRINDPANDSASSMFRIDEPTSSIDLTGTAQDLVVYHVARNAGTGLGDLAIWCDSIGSSQTATTVIESITVESADLPQLN